MELRRYLNEKQIPFASGNGSTTVASPETKPLNSRNSLPERYDAASWSTLILVYGLPWCLHSSHSVRHQALVNHPSDTRFHRSLHLGFG
jgi:hypothetical protein